MKNIKQIRGEFDLLTEAEQNEERKLIALIRSGLLDQSKLPILKRAMSKETKVLTPAERNALLELMNALMSQVLTNNSVYNKVRQNVMAEEVASLTKAREVEVHKAPTGMATMPSILVLKRKAIRVYPGGQNVGLYYSQQLDKYVAVPFGGQDKNVLSMNEEAEQIDEIAGIKRKPKSLAGHPSAIVARKVAAKRLAAGGLGDVETPTSSQGFTPTRLKKSLDRANHDQKNNIIKGANTALMLKNRVTKRKGAEEGEREINRIGKLASRYNAMKKRKTDAGVQKFKDEHDRKVKNDRSMRGSGSIGGDILQHAGDSPGIAIGHVIGKALYRRKNPKPITEAEIDEGILSSISSAASKVGGKISTGFKKFAAGAANNQSSSSKSGKPEKKYVDTDKQSKLRIKTSGVGSDRDRRAQRMAVQQPLAAQSRSVQEGTEVNLDGNTFLLNTSVASKVVATYQTLNEDNRRKMVAKMNESEESLNKIISFAVRH